MAMILRILVALLLVPAVVEAASMKFCWDDASTLGAAKVSAYAVNASMPKVEIADDLLTGSTVTTGKRCQIAPFPTTLQRGVDYSVTITQTNAVGEESGPSSAVNFRYPTAPTAPTGVTVVPSAP